MKFTVDQIAKMAEAKRKEQQEAAKSKRRISRLILREARVLAGKLGCVAGLKSKTKLREAIGATLAPYVHKQRLRVAGAFVRNH